MFLNAYITVVMWLQLSTSSRILLMPYPMTSVVLQFSGIGNELRIIGHEVYILLPGSYPELQKLKVSSGLKVIDYSLKEPDFLSMPRSDGDWVDVALNSHPLQEIRTNLNGFMQLCTNPLEDRKLPGRLRQLKFDLALIDVYPGTRCYWILAHRINVPYVSLQGPVYEPWLLRAPALPSFVPFCLAGDARLTERMTSWQRLLNTQFIIEWTVWPRITLMENSIVEKYLPGETFSTLAAKSLFWLIDTDVIIDYPRPTMPNELVTGNTTRSSVTAKVTALPQSTKLGQAINVGGTTTGPARELTGDLKEFADSAVNGLIVVAFGSMDFPTKRFFEEFFTAFSHLSEHHIVWRYAEELPEAYRDERVWPTHLLVKKWIPLNDLLGHFNTKLLIYHCGANSQFEALYHGVPQLCLTFKTDQPCNAARMQYHGFGVDLGCMRDVTVYKLVAGARDVISNSSYLDNIRAASAIYRSRPDTPRQRAAWWINHVLQHGGSHLHSYGLDMPWYEYLMLDVLIICLLLPVVVMTSVVTGCICCCISNSVTPTARHKQE